MDASAPAILTAVEGSAFGQAIRESVWAYPAANVLHVFAVTAFVSAVVVMDLALLGKIGGVERGTIVRTARRTAIALFVVVAASGFVLFTAEASHVAMNPVLQAKAVLILLALANALIAGRGAVAQVDGARVDADVPGSVRRVALVSLATWFAVVAAGRLIAYY
jgi:hypothetical protein